MNNFECHNVHISPLWHGTCLITTCYPASADQSFSRLLFSAGFDGAKVCKRSAKVKVFGLARLCPGPMVFLDASNCAQTSTLVAGLQASPAKPSGTSFWKSCAASLYISAQFPSLSPASVSHPTSLLSVPSNSSVRGIADSIEARPLTRAPRTTQLKALPCPILYQAKEPEAIADVLRRAGKKALGGGIPGSDLASAPLVTC